MSVSAAIGADDSHRQGVLCRVNRVDAILARMSSGHRSMSRERRIPVAIANLVPDVLTVQIVHEAEASSAAGNRCTRPGRLMFCRVRSCRRVGRR